MDIKKINIFFIYSVTLLLLLSLINGYYGLIILLENIEPAYGMWFQDLFISLIVIIFLHIDRFSFIGYGYLIFSLITGLIDSSHWITNNPIYWLQRGDFQAFIGISIWILELIFSTFGLAVWLWLKFHHHKLRPKY